MTASSDDPPPDGAAGKQRHLDFLRQPHIGVNREPDLAPERRRRPYAPSRRAVSDRSAHAVALSSAVDSSVAEVTEARDRFGITPDRLLVVEFHSWDPNARDVIEERFGAVVLHERLATRDDGARMTHVLVQFPNRETIERLHTELKLYGDGSEAQAALPVGVRRTFFECLHTVRPVSRDERYGSRLQRDGFPTEGAFALDLDLWSPGTPNEVRQTLSDLRTLCRRHAGEVLEHLETSNLVLLRVWSSRELAEALLDLDVVAQVDLPPVLPAAYHEMFREPDPLPAHRQPAGEEPVVTVVDSGVLAGHPLLRGWILDEYDFDTGEGTSVDQHGHGTQVAGLAVYGSVARCMERGTWRPDTMVLSAKVLVKDPLFPERAMFPERHRPEALVEKAIRHFHETRGCRVFNLSLGNDADVYAGGRQWPWAEVLDRLSRELDILIVVAAGNHANPVIPGHAASRDEVRKGIRDGRLSDRRGRLTNPATAAIPVVVGAIARSASPYVKNTVAGAPEHAPAPFSRVGPGYDSGAASNAVKPDFVAYGGNFGISDLVGSPTWTRNDIHLGEPTTRLNTDGGRWLTAVSGTSVAAPQISNAGAWAFETTAKALGTSNANAARSLLGVCAEAPPCDSEWICDVGGQQSADKLRLVGYGTVNGDRVRASLPHDVCLVASDELEEDRWHIYRVPVPAAFLKGKGARGIVVALAFDPPVRSSRRAYLARTMSLEVVKGLTTDDIIQCRSPNRGSSTNTKTLPGSARLDLRPARSVVQWSTLQVRRKTWQRTPSLPRNPSDPDPVVHVLVECQKRFPHGEGSKQRYGIAVRFWHSDERIHIYQQLRGRIRERVVVPARL